MQKHVNLVGLVNVSSSSYKGLNFHIGTPPLAGSDADGGSVAGGFATFVRPYDEEGLWSRRAAAGRAELRALTFLEARYGAFSAKMQTAGTLWVPCGVTSGVTSGYFVHFAGA